MGNNLATSEWATAIAESVLNGQHKQAVDLFERALGEHGEACLNYYRGLRNPRTVAEHGEVLALMLFYQRNKAAPHELLVQVKRDSYKMQKQREV